MLLYVEFAMHERHANPVAMTIITCMFFPSPWRISTNGLEMYGSTNSELVKCVFHMDVIHVSVIRYVASFCSAIGNERDARNSHPTMRYLLVNIYGTTHQLAHSKCLRVLANRMTACRKQNVLANRIRACRKRTLYHSCAIHTCVFASR